PAMVRYPIRVSELAISSHKHVIAKPSPCGFLPAHAAIRTALFAHKEQITMQFVWAAFANRQKSPTFAWNLQRAGDRAAQLQIGDRAKLKTKHHASAPRVHRAAEAKWSSQNSALASRKFETSSRP